MTAGDLTANRLPDQFRSELNLARSCDRRRFQHGVSWNVSTAAIDKGRHTGAEVGSVEQIECFSAELEFQFFAEQVVILEEREIEVFDTRGTHRITPEVS